MAHSRKNKTVRGVLTFIVSMLLLSGSIRLGSIGFAIASSPKELPVEAVCVTDAETQELMAMLNQRSKSIDLLEKAQAEREVKLRQAEADILANLERVEAAEAKLAQTIQRVDSASSDDIGQLTAVYQSMKPKDAALLFEQMSPDFASGFLSQMPPAVAAGILSGLSAEKAYAISVVLAGRNADAPKQ
ncbi:hypothetical protein [uncultured Litoreibacter sp.]|uniref:MotE family protein n=1 Tax=uncultured Litoreibacter sp. TaxID=1392394 RepID=UPI00262A0786|nr:hypothetical protein [uncultured Litoreibacter sp.]